MDDGGDKTDWTLEEYKLLETIISNQEALQVGLRRWLLGILSLIAALGYVLPRLVPGEVFEGSALLAFGVFVIIGFWLLELIHHVSQDQAERRILEIENDLAMGRAWIGHDLRLKQRVGATAKPSPRIGQVMKGQDHGSWKSLHSGARNARIWVFYLVLLGAFCAWQWVTNVEEQTEGKVSSAPARGEQLDEIEAAVARLPDELDRIDARIDALPHDVARSIQEGAPTINVNVDPPDLTPILGSLEDLRSGLAAIETAINEFEPVTVPAPTPPPPVAECESRAWGIGSSSVSCAPARP